MSLMTNSKKKQQSELLESVLSAKPKAQCKKKMDVYSEARRE
jgi:hypothetical protein